MAIFPLEPDRTGSPVAVFSAAGESVAELCERLPAGLSDEEIVAGVEAAQQLKATLAAWEAVAVAEADARDLARKRLHYGSTQDWYTHCAGVHRREGHRVVRHARVLATEYTQTLAAMRAGTTSPAPAAVICEALDWLPGDPQVRARGEEFLLAQSKTLTATELLRAGRHLAHVLDPEREDRKLEKELDREERAAHRDRFLSVTEDGIGGIRIKGRCSVEDGEVLKTALLPLTKPNPAVDPVDPEDPENPQDPGCETERDPREHGARMLDALIQLAQHALDTELQPECHGARPRVSVTLPYDDLKAQLAEQAVTDTGLDVSVATVLRWACDADLIPVCLTDCGEPLAVGRKYRLITAAQWAALVARDRHCTFPGCTRPPVMCHAHHIIHWIDGGPTDLDNLVLVCGEHHRVLHHTPWQVRLNPADGKPEFLPPPRRTHRATEHPIAWIRHRPRRQ